MELTHYEAALALLIDRALRIGRLNRKAPTFTTRGMARAIEGRLGIRHRPNEDDVAGLPDQDGGSCGQSPRTLDPAELVRDPAEVVAGSEINHRTGRLTSISSHRSATSVTAGSKVSQIADSELSHLGDASGIAEMWKCETALRDAQGGSLSSSHSFGRMRMSNTSRNCRRVFVENLVPRGEASLGRRLCGFERS